MITVVVPIFNEQDNIKPLLDEITQAAKLVPISEIIYVDDASTDNTYDTLTALRDDFPALRILKHQKNAGQSAALWTGVKNAGNDIVVTLGKTTPLTSRCSTRNTKMKKRQRPKLWSWASAQNATIHG